MKQARLAREEIARTEASKRFGKYKDEEKKEVREADVKKTETIKEMCARWRACDTPDSGIPEDYKYVHRFLRGIKFTAREVEEFSIALVEFQGQESEKAGLFFSVLINYGKDRDYMVHTRHMESVPDILGFNNKKNIIVNGNIGHYVGSHMRDGSLSVRGNIGNYAGNAMRNGCINIEGNAGDLLGCELRGGKIIVLENAGYRVGTVMKGGEIHIEGDIGSIGDVIHGKIFHRGKLIVDK